MQNGLTSDMGTGQLNSSSKSSATFFHGQPMCKRCAQFTQTHAGINKSKTSHEKFCEVIEPARAHDKSFLRAAENGLHVLYQPPQVVPSLFFVDCVCETHLFDHVYHSVNGVNLLHYQKSFKVWSKRLCRIFAPLKRVLKKCAGPWTPHRPTEISKIPRTNMRIFCLA